MKNRKNKLEGFQRKYLRGLAHKTKPVVFIGQKGITETLNRSIDDALTAHELIKLKYIDFKEKEKKTEIFFGQCMQKSCFLFRRTRATGVHNGQKNYLGRADRC